MSFILHEFKQVKEIKLDAHFENNRDLVSRNSTIIEALKDGYTQGKIARYLDVSSALFFMFLGVVMISGLLAGVMVLLSQEYVIIKQNLMEKIMTTLQINDTQVESLIHQYGQNIIIEYIKTFSPAKLYNEQKEKDKFQILKNQNFERKGVLYEAFSSLNQKLSQTNLNSIDVEKEKAEYFAQKYKL